MSADERLLVTVVGVTLRVAESRSLKDKRMIVRSVKDKLKASLGINCVEYGGLNEWQRAVLGWAQVGTNQADNDEKMQRALRLVESVVHVECIATDVRTYGDWPHVERRAVRGDDAFVPSAWQGEQES